MNTKNCIRCGKPARFWSGHVHRDGDRLTAGWCSAECYDAGVDRKKRKCAGCFGPWRRKDGVAPLETATEKT